LIVVGGPQDYLGCGTAVEVGDAAGHIIGIEPGFPGTHLAGDDVGGINSQKIGRAPVRIVQLDRRRTDPDRFEGGFFFRYRWDDQLVLIIGAGSQDQREPSYT
jgi:hypothetical protein